MNPLVILLKDCNLNVDSEIEKECDLFMNHLDAIKEISEIDDVLPEEKSTLTKLIASKLRCDVHLIHGIFEDVMWDELKKKFGKPFLQKNGLRSSC
jgi:hypothetical protein